jgi:hypothetical protein
MRLRRKRLLTVLDKDEIAPTVVAFPLMGVGEFTDPPAPPGVSTNKGVGWLGCGARGLKEESGTRPTGRCLW